MADLGVDALICPSSSLPALPHEATRKMTPAFSANFLYNVLHFPVGVVPITFVQPSEEIYCSGYADRISAMASASLRGSSGLPIGVQVVGLPYRDETVSSFFSRNLSTFLPFPFFLCHFSFSFVLSPLSLQRKRYLAREQHSHKKVLVVSILQLTRSFALPINPVSEGDGRSGACHRVRVTATVTTEDQRAHSDRQVLHGCSDQIRGVTSEGERTDTRFASSNKMETT
jgi:hypothetical protein